MQSFFKNKGLQNVPVNVPTELCKIKPTVSNLGFIKYIWTHMNYLETDTKSIIDVDHLFYHLLIRFSAQLNNRLRYLYLRKPVATGIN